MLSQIALGILIILASGVTHVVTLTQAPRCHSGLTAWARAHRSDWARTVAVCTSILWVMAAHLIQVGLWTLAFLSLGVFESVETTVYFVLVSFTTLGFGDVVAPDSWRLLSGFMAANGMLAFGWSTAFQVNYYASLRQS